MAAPAFEHPALSAHAAPATSPLSRGLLLAATTVALWETRARTRAALRVLPAERLPDLGLTTAEALREGAKPFWQA